MAPGNCRVLYAERSGIVEAVGSVRLPVYGIAPGSRGRGRGGQQPAPADREDGGPDYEPAVREPAVAGGGRSSRATPRPGEGGAVRGTGYGSGWSGERHTGGAGAGGVQCRATASGAAVRDGSGGRGGARGAAAGPVRREPGLVDCSAVGVGMVGKHGEPGGGTQGDRQSAGLRRIAGAPATLCSGGGGRRAAAGQQRHSGHDRQQRKDAGLTVLANAGGSAARRAGIVGGGSFGREWRRVGTDEAAAHGD